jgi:cellulose synthase/poly-beta-1,6-N-acetylglucosamine synthase-like glycosyltransferase
MAALWQSRFTFLVEAFALERRNIGGLRVLRWAIGNGLFLRLDCFRRFGGFSERHLVEDTELGFRLSLEDVPIRLLPVFLESGNPDGLRADVRQKMRWFKGVWDYRRYAADARSTPRAAVAVWLAAQGIIRGLGWLLFGPMILFVLAYGWLTADDWYDYVLAVTGLLYASSAVLLSGDLLSRLSEAPIARRQIIGSGWLIALVALAPVYAIAFCLVD